MVLKSDFWNGKRVFITGHTGFKGAWLAIWLKNMGADVFGYSLAPETEKCMYEITSLSEKINEVFADIRSLTELTEALISHGSQIVIHCAAQSLVRYSYDHPIETYDVNLMGTLNVLEAIRRAPEVKAAVMVTTDKCYENNEWVWGYREIDPMGGFDPYSSSKGCAELLIASYRNSYLPVEAIDDHGKAIASVRAGNVVGGGDWASDRLIPDIIRAFQNDEKVSIRNPGAIRPWQHVLEPLSGYILLAQKLYEDGKEYAEPWNFGPRIDDAKPVEWIVNYLSKYWDKDNCWIPNNEHNPHEANFLKLDWTKAAHKLGWAPRYDIEECLKETVSWYKNEAEGEDMYGFTLSQINKFVSVVN